MKAERKFENCGKRRAIRRCVLAFLVSFGSFLFMEQTVYSAPKTGEGEKGSEQEKKKQQLSSEQYRVAVLCGTESPFQNAYWNNKEEGIYVCVVSGKPLFASWDKFDSGTGWPSFLRPIDKTVIEEVEDRGHGMVRVEVRSKPGDTHLGHVFPDGPGPEGLRYCINSASLRFVPLSKMVEEGYGAWMPKKK